MEEPKSRKGVLEQSDLWPGKLTWEMRETASPVLIHQLVIRSLPAWGAHGAWDLNHDTCGRHCKRLTCQVHPVGS